jgi:hypothetical protein
MGISGSSQIMDRGSMMNMMHQNPGMMQMMMGNMMDVVSSDSTMSRQMVNMMTSHPELMQMMHRYNNMKMGAYNDNKTLAPGDKSNNMGHYHNQ